MKPKVKLTIKDWKDIDGSIERALYVNDYLIDNYYGEDYFIFSRILKHLGYEVILEFINDNNN